jgi:hypothetical protein
MQPLLTLNSQTVPSGNFTSPMIGIPAIYNFAELRASRGAWPVAGVTVSLLVSYDAGLTFQVAAGPLVIAPFVPTAKQASATDAAIGFGWNQERRVTHAKIQSNSPQSFVSNLKIMAG